MAWAIAERGLEGVGDAHLGEWREIGGRAVHIRRRLSEEERLLAGGLEMRDIRGTLEEVQRLEVVLEQAPHAREYVKQRLREILATTGQSELQEGI